MLRQKYIVGNILEEFYGQVILVGHEIKVTRSVTNYCCQKVSNNITFEGVTNE